MVVPPRVCLRRWTVPLLYVLTDCMYAVFAPSCPPVPNPCPLNCSHWTSPVDFTNTLLASLPPYDIPTRP